MLVVFIGLAVRAAAGPALQPVRLQHDLQRGGARGVEGLAHRVQEGRGLVVAQQLLAREHGGHAGQRQQRIAGRGLHLAVVQSAFQDQPLVQQAGGGEVAGQLVDAEAGLQRGVHRGQRRRGGEAAGVPWDAAHSGVSVKPWSAVSAST
jgi:hypothetical protein